MIDIAHLVRDNFYFQSAPKPVGQEVTKGKKPATQNWSDLGQAKQEVVRVAEIQSWYPPDK